MARFISAFAASFALVLLAGAAAHAGDVTASVKGQILTLKGDNGGADLLLAPPVPLSRGASAGITVQVTPQGGTTLDGAAVAEDFDGIVDVKMTLGDGANTVLFQNLSFDGKLTFKSGDGADTLTIQDTGFDDDVNIKTGNGAEHPRHLRGERGRGRPHGEVRLRRRHRDPLGPRRRQRRRSPSARVPTRSPPAAAVGDDFSYKGGEGAETLTLSGAVGGQAQLKLSNGANTVTLADATPIGEALKIKGGTGNDTISLGNLPIGEDANLNLSAGDNTVSLTDTTIGENLIVKGKSGNDTVTFTGTVTIGEESKFSLDGGTNTTP